MCRFGILSCDNSPRWQSNAKQPRRNVEGAANQFVELFVDTYGEAADEWKAFPCCEFEWPSVDEAKEFDAVFITGSTHSALDSAQTWVPELCHMLLLYVQERVKVVGICFGAQLLGLALGGRVGRNPEGNFIALVEDIEVLPVLSSLLERDIKSLSAIEVHGDQVVELPEDAVLLGSSRSCVNEIWCFRTALAIQSHPELTLKHMFKSILPELQRTKKITEAEARFGERTLNTKKRTHSILIDFVKKFTRSNEFVAQRSYRDLFPLRVNSKSDPQLIEEIKEIAERMHEAPFSANSVVRNPELDAETKEVLQTGVNNLTDQFSTLMLKELRRAMLDYEGIRLGNAVVHENTKTLLTQALELCEPIKELRMERVKVTDEVNQILMDVAKLIQSLEESAYLLETQTRELRQRLSSTVT